jgi:hypothetical protein
VHGDSTVCASMDIREHPPVRHLTEEDLNNVIKSSEQNVDNCSVEGAEQKDEIDMSNKGNMQSVILAPFGLSAVLTGTKSENIEQHAEKIINDWNTFYSMKQLDSDTLSSKLPLLVEVISGEITFAQNTTCDRSITNVIFDSFLLGGVKMLYPSKYVLITEMDLESKIDKCTNENKKCLDISRKYKSTNKIETDCMEQTFSDGIQKSVSGVLPERVWQDVVMNPAYTSSSSSATSIDKCENAKSENLNQSNEHSNAAHSVEGSLWNFVEPCLKNSCACKRQVTLTIFFYAPTYLHLNLSKKIIIKTLRYNGIIHKIHFIHYSFIHLHTHTRTHNPFALFNQVLQYILFTISQKWETNCRQSLPQWKVEHSK